MTTAPTSKIGALAAKYRDVAVLLAAVAVFGFIVVTPQQRLTKVEEVNDQQTKEIVALKHYVRANAIDLCLNRPAQQTQLMQLDCSDLLRGQALDVPAAAVADDSRVINPGARIR